MNLPTMEILDDRLAHWTQVLEQAERARDFALRQVQNCQALKQLVSGAATIVLLHGGELDTDL